MKRGEKGQLSKAFSIAIFALILAFLIQNTYTLWIEVIAWIYLSYLLYRRLFIWANKVNMGNDLAFFGLKLVGGIFTFISLYIGVSFLFVVSLNGFSPITVPIAVVLGGLIMFCIFIALRTKRRSQVVGVWEA